jgi:hypothetical protein
MYEFECRNLKDRDGLEGIHIHGFIIIMWFFMEIHVGWDGVDSNDVAPGKNKC